MNQFFAGDYSGEPFQLFGTAHIIALIVIVLLNLWIVYLSKKQNDTVLSVIRYALIVVLLVNESLWHYWNYSIGQWTIQTMLPLHICSVFVFLSAIMLAIKSYGIYEFAYLLGIAGASQALLTPDAGVYGFPHFRFFQVMISHGAIVTAAIFMTFAEGLRPYKKSIVRVIIGSNIYMLIIGIVNWLIGSNYLYIAHKPETASLLDVLGPWPVYIIFVELIGFTFVFLLYLPFAIKDLRSHRQKAAVHL
jgi:hypothetical integral membrane protein (TIGR02206 family)